MAIVFIKLQIVEGPVVTIPLAVITAWHPSGDNTKIVANGSDDKISMTEKDFETRLGQIKNLPTGVEVYDFTKPAPTASLPPVPEA